MHENTNPRNETLTAWALSGDPEAFWTVFALAGLLGFITLLAGA